MAEAQAQLELSCRHCGAALQVPPTLRTLRCPYCASPSVVERPPNPGCPEPRFGLGFSVTEARAQSVVREWLGRRRWFAPSNLRRARVEGLRGVYLPAYLYSALARTQYRADIG